MATDPIEERLRAAADAYNSEITDEDLDEFTDKVLTRLDLERLKTVEGEPALKAHPLKGVHKWWCSAAGEGPCRCNDPT